MITLLKFELFYPIYFSNWHLENKSQKKVSNTYYVFYLFTLGRVVYRQKLEGEKF